ncbi:unnamed protein product [Darwinula stevensoni]|uniref:Protein sleepless n=1 Tax=Darwinula stevensoni TaxID=69355 RepID=A0A7R9AFD3_9CRUS|nr:unnamed protein product [Darwinula stevensoni]CAG0902511.1 unnamed protein product [Darwinula stevensoni]
MLQRLARNTSYISLRVKQGIPCPTGDDFAALRSSGKDARMQRMYPSCTNGWMACLCQTDLCNGAVSILLSARVSLLVLLPFLSVGRLLFLRLNFAIRIDTTGYGSALRCYKCFENDPETGKCEGDKNDWKQMNCTGDAGIGNEWYCASFWDENGK